MKINLKRVYEKPDKTDGTDCVHAMLERLK